MRNGYNLPTIYKNVYSQFPVFLKSNLYKLAFALSFILPFFFLNNQLYSLQRPPSNHIQSTPQTKFDTIIAAAPIIDTLVNFESEWKYLDDGTALTNAWTFADFIDSSWKSGTGKFGYGISDLNTVVGFGDSAHKKYVTTYFRKTLELTDSTLHLLNHFFGKVKRDDGAIIYINGQEVLRSNMPLNAVTANTFAPGSASDDNGTVEIAFTIPDSILKTGKNIIAAEVHQYSSTSPDLAFDLQLIGKSDFGRPEPPTILFYEGFEEEAFFSGLKKQIGTDYGFTIDSIVTFKDAKVGRWELQANDSTNKKGIRAETMFPAAFAQEETWHSFAAYFPSDGYQTDRHSEIINQWHQGIGGLPMLTLRTVNDNFVFKKRGFDTLPNIKYNLGPISKDRWVSFVIHLKQHPTNGLVQIWIDDELKLDLQGGATMFEGPLGRWKMGLYKNLWNNEDTLSATKRVWYVDEVKIGNTSANYEFMRPVGNHIASQQQQSAKPILFKEKDEGVKNNSLVVYPTLIKKGALLNVKTNTEKPVQAFITDLSGRTVNNFKINTTALIETANLPPGTYVLLVEHSKTWLKQKFVVVQ